METVPSDELQKQWQIIDTTVLDMKGLGSRINTNDWDGKRKADSAPDGDDKRASKRSTNPGYSAQQDMERGGTSLVDKVERH